MFYFWREVGRRMNIRQLPDDYHGFESFNVEYEREHYRYTDANHRVGVATRELFVSWVPRFLAPVVRRTIHTVMDERVRETFGFPRPSRFTCWLVSAGLKLRARVLRWLPPRRQPRLRTEMKRRTYPRGYAIEELGPGGAIQGR